MERAVCSYRLVRFGTFEVDLRAAELRKSGLKLKLSGQPFQILAILLEHPGDLVTRAELQKRLWPDTFVDADHSLNTAINKIREALGDSAESPRFVETLPRKGYRFIGQVTRELPRPMVLQTATQVSAPTTRLARPMSGWIGVAIVALLVVVLGWLRWRPLPEPSVLSSVPFTSFLGMEFAPTFSPDGSRIAFAWDGRDGNEPSVKGFDLYVKAIGSETVLRLTNRPSEWISPAWSPDGTQIAFHRISGADTGIYLVPALGGPERKLRSTHVPYNLAAGLSWSPDAKWVAYGDTVGGKFGDRMFLLSMETMESRQVPHNPECDHEANLIFQHKGGTLAFLCVRTTEDLALYSVPLAALGGTPKFIASVPNFIAGMTWSSDDTRLIFSQASRYEGGWLDEVTVADGRVRRLPIPPGDDHPEWPAISPSGKGLAYSSSTNHVSVRRKELAQPGGPNEELVVSTRTQSFPQYSPDGTHVAFDSTRSGVWSVWVGDADGGNPVQISSLGTAGFPRWSPDSREITFERTIGGHYGVYIADVAERVPRKLVSNVPDMGRPYWSHDGRWIYFRSHETVGDKIYRCPATGGDAQLLATALNASAPQESFDGKVLYFMPRPVNSELRMVSLDGALRESAVAGLPTLADDTLFAVTRDGIYFVPEAAPQTVAYFDFATKRVRDVFKVDKTLEDGLSVSPDGRFILFSQDDEQNSDIMFVNQFR